MEKTEENTEKQEKQENNENKDSKENIENKLEEEEKNKELFSFFVENLEKKRKEIQDLNLSIKNLQEKYVKIVKNFEEEILLIKKTNQNEKNFLSKKLKINFSKEIVEFISLFDITESSKDLVSIKAGIEMMKKKFISYLKKLDILQIDTKIGDKFNSEIHDGVGFQETENEEFNATISKILVPGYLIEDSVLKPTIVEIFQLKK